MLRSLMISWFPVISVMISMISGQVYKIFKGVIPLRIGLILIILPSKAVYTNKIQGEWIPITVNGEKFAGLNFRVFHGFQEVSCVNLLLYCKCNLRESMDLAALVCISSISDIRKN